MDSNTHPESVTPICYNEEVAESGFTRRYLDEASKLTSALDPLVIDDIALGLARV